MILKKENSHSRLPIIILDPILKNLISSNNSKLLFTSFMQNLNKLKKLQNKRKIRIDKNGVKRIVNILNNKNKNIKIKTNYVKKNLNHKNGFFIINKKQ